MACVNAAGNEVPPLVVVKGKTQASVSSYNVGEGPVGTRYTYQCKGWMEDLLGVEWYTNYFLQHCGTARPQLLVLDSHSSHETLGLIESAKENNIILLALPPHTTQWLNPLDKTLFGPFNRECNKACTEFMSKSPNNLVCKWEWPRLFRIAHDRAFNRENIKKGFDACGIFPTNPKRIPATAYSPSEPFDLQEFAVSQTQTPVSTELAQPENNEETPDVVPVEVLATADDEGKMVLEGKAAADLLAAIAEGKFVLPSDENFAATDAGDSPMTDEATSSAQAAPTPSALLTLNWNQEVDALFKMPSATPVRANQIKEKLLAIAC